MKQEIQPFLYSYRYSSLTLPGPILYHLRHGVSPLLTRGFKSALAEFLGALDVAAPTDAPMNGIEVAPPWLCDTARLGFPCDLAGSQAFLTSEG